MGSKGEGELCGCLLVILMSECGMASRVKLEGGLLYNLAREKFTTLHDPDTARNGSVWHGSQPI